MFAVLATVDDNTFVEDVYVVNTHEEAVEVTRTLILQAYAEDIDTWSKDSFIASGEGRKSMLRQAISDFNDIITMSWEDMQNLMADGNIDWINIKEVAQLPTKPDMRPRCIEFPIKRRPCGGCFREKDCRSE